MRWRSPACSGSCCSRSRSALGSWRRRSRPSRWRTLVVGILLGVLLFDERLSRPAWHVVVACIGLGVALVGAVLIALARHGGEEQERPVASVATA
jgi:hypothetical protein